MSEDKKGKKDRWASPYMTTAEAARYLRVNVRTMDNWRSMGEGPKYRKHGGRVRYHEDDVVRYSERRSGGHYG